MTMTHTIKLVTRAKNSKTGGIPQTWSDSSTCPSTCPHIGEGCYASAHVWMKKHWEKVSDLPTTSWSETMRGIAALPSGSLWRHNVAGDLSHTQGVIDSERLADLIRANHGRRGFAYTHHLPLPQNISVVRQANRAGMTINWSAETLEQADRLAETRSGPVVVVLPAYTADMPAGTRLRTPGGRSVVVCPATQTGSRVTCRDCKACAVPERKSIIGFPAHGAQRKVVEHTIRMLREREQQFVTPTL